jgi:quercetin dioxygenase-like cupin family protein
MAERLFKVAESIPSKGKTSREIICRSKIHEINLWRVTPGKWVYPHIHPYNDDIWYIIQGEGNYYLTAEETQIVKSGDILVATPGDVHGIYNTGNNDIIIYSILSPLPVKIEPAQGFDYPE